MRITPPPLAIDPTEGFTPQNDIFGYTEFGQRLATLIANISDPLVLALDGPWGSGKSTFIRQWAGHLRNEGFPVIVFDAFENDYQEDAFIALAGEIAALARRHGTKEGAIDKFTDSAKRAGKLLLPIGVRTILRAVTLGALSSEDAKALGETASQVLHESAHDVAAMAEEYVKDRLDQADVDREVLTTFRSELETLVTTLGQKVRKGSQSKEGGLEEEQQSSRPLVFIVDELDRCRPPFALGVLERTKHLFSVNGVCFVLVTHVAQLQEIVRGAYGANIDAGRYLEKFIQLRVVLPQPIEPSREQRARYIRYLWDALNLHSKEPHHDRLMREGLGHLANVHGLSLRTIERISAHVALVNASTDESYFRVAPLLVGLCVMRQVAPNLYEAARAARLDWASAGKFLKLDLWATHDDEKERYEHWWRVFTDTAIEDAGWAQEIHAIVRRHSLRREQVLPLLASFIDDLDNDLSETNRG